MNIWMVAKLPAIGMAWVYTTLVDNFKQDKTHVINSLHYNRIKIFLKCMSSRGGRGGEQTCISFLAEEWGNDNHIKHKTTL